MRAHRFALAAVAAVMTCLATAGGALAQLNDPAASPPGSNVPCVPSAAHPNPVLLVHGLGANQSQNWSFVSPRLKAAGYCVYSLTYGRTPSNPPPFDRLGGTGPVEASGQQLGALVDQVLAATGAAKVDLVGHSEGTVVSGWYAKNLGAAKVERIVSLTPLWRGTNVALAGTLATLGEPSGATDQVRGGPFGQGCRSCFQLLTGSEFMAELNSGGGPAAPGVAYTNIITRYDELVVPYWSGWLEGATNHIVQRICPADPSEHAAVAFNPIVLRVVMNALDPATAEPVDCTDAASF